MRRALRILSALFGLLGAAGAESRTWYVKPDGTGEAPTIQAAVDSARAGDVVVLAAGLYTWSSQAATSDDMVILKAGVSLRGESGPEVTILDGEGAGRVIRCQDVGEVRIEGVTIQRGYGPIASASLFGGGGICSVGDSWATIVNCVIRENQGAVGGGIQCDNATLSHCEILDNQSLFGRAGGVYCGNSITLSSCTIRGNSSSGGESGIGGGICTQEGSFVDCRFEENIVIGTFGGGGGAIECWRRIDVTRCTFLNNAVWTVAGNGLGAAIYLRTEVQGRITDCVFADNQIRVDNSFVGAGVVFGDSGVSLDIAGCTFIGNSARGTGSSAGISLDPRGGRGTIRSSIIAWNEGAPCFGSTWQFECTNLFGNSAGDAICGTDLGGNFNADPEFCAPDPVAALNFSLRKSSPCAPGNHPSASDCGLIGARPVECEGTTVHPMTWSEVKAKFRR